MEPKVSVIMPIYNAEKYVKETIDGILNQTFEDFELLLINDHPTDKTMEIVKDIKDSRIRIIENERNRGIAYSRNRGLEEARGQYIALMDDDDLTDRERLKLEVDFLDSHLDIGVIGGSSVNIDESNRQQSEPAFILTNPDYIRAQMMFFCPMANSSTMFRKNIIEAYGIRYQENCLGMEDYRFWIEMSLHTKITNFQKTFLYWRSSATGETSRIIENRREERKKLFAEFQIYGLESNGFRLSDQEKKVFTEAFEESKSIIYSDLEQLYRVLRKLVNQAYELGLTFADEMRYTCRNYYLEMVRRNHVICKEGMKKDGFSCQKENPQVKVSVIIPTHNRANKLFYSVNSVLLQSYNNYEVLIIDDCSTDNTKDVVKQLQDEYPGKIIYYKLEKNSGPAKARNFGVGKAIGKYIAFHDDDDEWYPDKLEIQMKKMLQDNSIDLTFGQMTRYLGGKFVNIVCDRFDWYHIQDRFFQQLLMENYIGAPTIVMKKEAFIRLGGFCEKIPSLEDWDLAIRAARELHIEFINTPLMDVHITRKSVTHNIENYVYSWAYLMQAYISEAENRDTFIIQMFRHLEGAMYETDNALKQKYVELASQLIVPSVILPNTVEEKLLELYFVKKDESVLLSQAQQNVERLRRYRSVCAKLLDPDDTIARWLLKKGLIKVAIYGMGNFGKCLADRLQNGGIEVVCGIDKKQLVFRNIPVVSLRQFRGEYSEVDAIIVTPLYEFTIIAEQINSVKEKVYMCISVEELLQ
jgi:glycosyltransferase involved in cell wall biosynthesis